MQQVQRPPKRPSMGVRYGDMRSALREAALARAQRRQTSEAADDV